MIEFDEAVSLILSQCQPTEPVDLAMRQAIGKVLAEPIVSDIDSPPYDKAMVDGYAVISADFTGDRPVQLEVLEQVTAGQVPTQTVTAGHATQIMTGAPIPDGADAVVMVERTSESSQYGRTLTSVDDPRFVAGQHIMRQATAIRCGQTVLVPGAVVRPIEVGMASEVGRTKLAVHRSPSVAVVPTGDELVPADQLPGPGQIRNSNGPMLAAQVVACGAEPIDLGVAADNADTIKTIISQGLDADILVLSGGVSAGVLDLVPGVLADLGVQQVFHKVRLKPGKPIWFGTLERAGRKCLVFGLPGNPVSSLVCFELFVRPAIEKLAGHREVGLACCEALLTEPYEQKGDRTTFRPARINRRANPATVEIVSWQGSADQASLAEANSLVRFSPGERSYSAGEKVDVLIL